MAAAVRDGPARFGSVIQPQRMVQRGRFPMMIKNSGTKAELRQERDKKEERRRLCIIVAHWDGRW